MHEPPRSSGKFKTIDEYRDTFPEGIRVILQQLRQAIRQAAPQAVEVISYNMPAFRFKRVLVYYAVHKEHIGLYPTASPIIVFKDELSKYTTSKGTIQFPLDKPLPVKLIKKIVVFRLAEDIEKPETKKRTTK